MKKTHLLPYCVLLVAVNCYLPWSLYVLGYLMKRVFHHMVEDHYWPITHAALALPPWFLVFTVLSIMIFVGAFWRRVSSAVLVHALISICIIEGAALYLFVRGVVNPFFGMDWFPMK